MYEAGAKCASNQNVIAIFTLKQLLLLLGVGIYEGVHVEGVDVEGGRVTGVRTSKGSISCEIFINCAGQVRSK